MRIFQRRIPTIIASTSGFSELYERNRSAVFRYIYGLTGGPAEMTEDLTAETFLRAWKRRHHFNGNFDAATGWLILIAKRLVIDRYRRRAVQREKQALLIAEIGSGPEQGLLDAEDKQILTKLLDDLPSETREVLVLRFM